MAENDQANPPPGVEVAPRVRLPESALRFTFARSSGPGGQNVNKLATKARLHVALADLQAVIGPAATRRLEAIAGAARLTDAGDLVLVCEESRSQRDNRDACLERLRELLLRAIHVPKVRRATKPTYGSKLRRLDDKQERARTKKNRRRDYPSE